MDFETETEEEKKEKQEKEEIREKFRVEREERNKRETEEKIKKWREEKAERERKGDEEMKKTVLIIKRGIKANRKKDVETWVKEVLKIKGIRICRGIVNKEAVKVFCSNDKIRKEIWERRHELKEMYGMFIDKWLTIEERKERYEMRERVKEMREENRKRGLKIDIVVDSDMAKIGGRWYMWSKGRWNEAGRLNEEREEKEKSKKD